MAILVTFETTAGDLVLELDEKAAPATVDNFLHYVQEGFYGGLVFHRVIQGFVAQAGGYFADGRRKAPLRPPVKLETTGLKHVDGALGMARLPEPNSATSEFYLCDGPQPDLDGNYCIFGSLIKGQDTLRRILTAPKKRNDWPEEAIIILRAYEGEVDASNPTPKFELPKSDKPADFDEVRAAARKLRGRAAILRARRPLLAMGEVEAAIAHADRTGKREDLERAQEMLALKEKR